MGKATGVELKAAARKASAWGTAVACGANDGVLILPHTLTKKRGSFTDDSLGSYFPEGSDAGEVAVEGELPAYLRYDGLDLLLALAMGQTEGAPVQQGSTAAYAQGFTLAEATDGLFCTFAADNQVNVDEYTSLKFTGFTLKGEVGRPLGVSFHALAEDRVTGSSVNTTASFAAVTNFETVNRVLMGQGAMRMNAQGGVALGAGDEIYPSAFEFTFKRKMRGVYGSSGGLDTIDEPTNDGPPEVTLLLEFPRYTAKTYFEDWDAGNLKKLDMVFTGAEIESPYNREFKVQFPNLKIASAELPVQRGILRHPVRFQCLACSTAPSGMSGITEPFRIDVINRQTADVLA